MLENILVGISKLVVYLKSVVVILPRSILSFREWILEQLVLIEIETKTKIGGVKYE